MATMKTLNGYGFNATEFNGKTSDSYLLKTDTVANSTNSQKLGGKAPEYYLNPRNLLDNSDFRNPVNQRGNGDVNTQGDYPIDRWMFDKNGSGCSAGYDANYKYLYIVNNATDGSWGSLYHNVPSEKLNAGTYTICFHEKLIGPISMLAIADDTVTVLESAMYEPDENGLIIAQFTISSRPSNKLLIAVYATQGITVAFDWAALYEGSYTAETLPPYVPKGKHVEMLNCGVSLTPHNLLDNSDFTNPVNQRGKTSYTAQGYTIDRWYSNNANKAITLSNTGITLSTGSTLFQKLDLIDALAGKTITAAVCFADGTIAVKSGISTNNGAYTSIVDVTQNNLRIRVYEGTDGYIRFQFEPNANIKLQWAALYEGSYTADTLPPYVPKGYAAEFAECRRYFRRYTAKDASLILSGLVTSGAKDISVHAPELTPMRAKNVSIAYSGSGVIIRGVSGYATECSDSSIYGNISVSPYQNNSSFCATIDINKKDGTAWGLTNNTPVVVQFAANSTLDYIADL